MTTWEVWALYPNGDKEPGWGMAAHKLTQDQAEWFAETLLMKTRVMERAGQPARTVREMRA